MRTLKSLNLCDEFLFKEVMRDKELLIEFLERTLDLRGKIRDIKYLETEKTIQNKYLVKSIRLDVYVKDIEEAVYNIEIQNGKLKIIPKRSRKYQSDMDMEALKRGEEYDKLNKQYIIFVCTGDPFGEGLYKYTFTNRCHELDGLELGDETYKIFLNTKGTKGPISDDLKAFLEFVEDSSIANAQKINDPYIDRLSAKVEEVKQNEELGGVFMTLEEKINEERRDSEELGYKRGIEQGMKQGIERGTLQNRIEIAQNMMNKGFSPETIKELTGLTLEEIEAL